MQPLSILSLQAVISAIALSPIPIPLGVLGKGLVIDFPGTSLAKEVEYVAWDGLGREAANSAKRGLSLTLPADGDALLGPATVGLRAGGSRLVWFSAETLEIDLGGVFPPKTDAILWVVGK
ncbi:hypothetical protein EON81_13925 [bacterium]|nr:MAG: hypothetical protein EON81_13925 [bacterium]